MSYFEFINQVKICSGDNALCNATHELSYLGASKPMILSDKGLEKVGTLKTVLKVFSKNNLDTSRVFTDIPTDSSTDTINQIVKTYKECGADSIIAIGGGSVIDTAKGVKLVLSQDVDDILKLEGNEIMPLGKLVPFIVVPTTCGTGSECTAVAVIKNSETHIKMEFISPTLLPNVSILDSMVIETLPPKLMATTSIDALTHAIEGYSCLGSYRRAATLTRAPRAAKRRAAACPTRPKPVMSTRAPWMVTGICSIASWTAPSAVGTALATASSSRAK